MKSTLTKFLAVLSVAMATPQFAIADGGYSFVQLENGWTAMAKQTDPFDDTKKEIIFMYKESFNVSCRYFNWASDTDIGFDSFSFSDISIKYRIGSDEPVTKDGHYSTYLDGLDMMTSDRYYSFKMNDEDIQNLKAEGDFQLAAKLSKDSPWESVKINLKGFTISYDEMCK